MLDRGDFMSKNKEKKSTGNITFINMPIASADEDKIGITQYAAEIQAVIKKGAQSIAVTSDFGGGKSSLIRRLESMYSSLTTKFCYVNLWSQLSGDDSEDLHKSFIYQLASQIGVKKGNYVSRRMSQNYGMFGITLPSIWSSILSFIMFLLLAAGFACTTFYEEIAKYVDIAFFDTYHNKLGVASFSMAAFLALVFLYNTDIMFSSKNSETGRTIDEHELMDIYRTHICNFHLRHYIVVIEDLDRSDKKSVNKFIKELRRYYVPYKHKRSKCPTINWIKDNILGKINRITFIVNIKAENKIATEDDNDLYSKAFDYVLDLKEINIDNFDIILNKLLEDNRKLFTEKEIPAFTDDEKFIPEFEWIIRGQKNGIREIKHRLNVAISTYVNLCSKFNKEFISLKKCIASAYIITAFEKEYLQIKELGFDSIIDLYVTNPKMTKEDITNEYNKGKTAVTISSAFAEDIKTLINNGLIDSDYRKYFFNFPSDSYMRSDKQNRLNNIILYDQDITSEEGFNDIVSEVINTDRRVIIESFDRLKRLGKYFPHCVFFNKELFDLALSYDSTMMYKTLGEKLQYDAESISSTARIVIGIIKRNLLANQEAIDEICKIVSTKAPARSVVTFRRHLIENLGAGVAKFKELFLGERPLITKAEVEALLNNSVLLDLVNLESSELDLDLVQTIHTTILSGLDLSQDDLLKDVVDFYVDLYKVLGSTENKVLTAYMFEVISMSKVIPDKLETLIIKNNKLKEIQEKYVGVIGLADQYGKLSPNTLRYINDLEICFGLPESVCIKLKEAGFGKAFIVNAYRTNIALIDFGDPKIISVLQQIDFTNEDDKTVSVEMLLSIRKHILSSLDNAVRIEYKHLFMSPNPIITEPELQLITNKVHALSYIDTKQIDESNCDYIAKYLCQYQSTQNESYEILCFATSIEDSDAKRAFFFSLDLDKVQYYRISAQRKKNIVDNMPPAFDFDDVAEQLAFMAHTKCTNSSFEKQIKKAIAENEFAALEERYSKYVRKAKKVTNDMINNLCAGRIYAMPPHILEKLYAAKKYTYYFVSKTLEEKRFTIEEDKIDVLMPVYEDVFMSDEGAFKYTKSKMAENEIFISMMRDKQIYVDTPLHTRKLFAYALQTVHCLQDLFDNYAKEFITEYLSDSKGFYDRDAAVCFIELLRRNSAVAASDIVYENNYSKLEDSALKSNYTKCHNSAKNFEALKKTAKK